jgi:hypothetical protein
MSGGRCPNCPHFQYDHGTAGCWRCTCSTPMEILRVWPPVTASQARRTLSASYTRASMRAVVAVKFFMDGTQACCRSGGERQHVPDLSCCDGQPAGAALARHGVSRGDHPGGRLSSRASNGSSRSWAVRPARKESERAKVVLVGGQGGSRGSDGRRADCRHWARQSIGDAAPGRRRSALTDEADIGVVHSIMSLFGSCGSKVHTERHPMPRGFRCRSSWFCKTDRLCCRRN